MSAANSRQFIMNKMMRAMNLASGEIFVSISDIPFFVHPIVMHSIIKVIKRCLQAAEPKVQ